MVKESELAALFVQLLDRPDRDELLAAQQSLVLRSAELERVTGQYGRMEPNPLTGLLAQIVCGAMVRAGQPEAVKKFLENLADLFAPEHRYYVHGGNLGDLLGAFPSLHVPLAAALMTAESQGEAAHELRRLYSSFHRHRTVAAVSASHEALAKHPAFADYGPISPGPHWLLEKYLAVRALDPPDLEHEGWVDFDEELTGLALETARFADASIVFDEHLAAADRLVRWNGAHLGFHCVCYLAALERPDEAVALAKEIIRHGYRLVWRFLPDRPHKDWTSVCRQDEWLGRIAETNVFRAFIKDYVIWREPPDYDLPCLLEESVLGGGKPKKCRLTKRSIQPGEAIIRMIRLHDRASEPREICHPAAFDSAPWDWLAHDFREYRAPLETLFDLRRRAHIDDPDICVFFKDIARDPRAFDIERAAAVIASEGPKPIRFSWRKGGKNAPAAMGFTPFSQDRGHGDAVNLVWRIVRAGHSKPLMKSVSALSEGRADMVFAMLACFDEPHLREQAARHFECPQLPEIMTLVFKSPLNLQDHLRIAAFGRDHSRFRIAIAKAMQRYALNLYSNYHPDTDWYLQGLQNFTYAHGCQLLYFLIHHPEGNPVLDTCVRNAWLPSGVGSGGYDAYDNASGFYHRAATLYLALTSPEKLADWLQQDWMGHLLPKRQYDSTLKFAASIIRKGR